MKRLKNCDRDSSAFLDGFFFVNSKVLFGFFAFVGRRGIRWSPSPTSTPGRRCRGDDGCPYQRFLILELFKGNGVCVVPLVSLPLPSLSSSLLLLLIESSLEMTQNTFKKFLKILRRTQRSRVLHRCTCYDRDFVLFVCLFRRLSGARVVWKARRAPKPPFIRRDIVPPAGHTSHRRGLFFYK